VLYKVKAIFYRLQKIQVLNPGYSPYHHDVYRFTSNITFDKRVYAIKDYVIENMNIAIEGLKKLRVEKVR
jgi:hypothetical protein